MTTVEVTLVRHAQTVANQTGTWQGQGDSALSDRGRRQAEQFGARFGGEAFDRVVASDLRRTRDTVATLARDDVGFDPAWREIDVGRWEGLTRDEVRERFADEILRLEEGAPIRIGGGESWHELEHRVDAAFAKVLEGVPDGGRVLVMTHGGVIHALVSGLLGLRSRRFRPIGRIMNTAVTRLRVVGTPGAPGARVEVHSYNDGSHVGPRSEYLAELLAKGAGALAVVSTAGAVDPGRFETLRGWYPDLPADPVDLGMAPLELGGLGRLAESGGVRGVVTGPAEAARLARAAIAGPQPPSTGTAIGVRELPDGQVAHLVWTSGGVVLGDYGLVPARAPG